MCASPPTRLFDEASDPGDILFAPAAIDYDFPPGDWESIGYSAARQQSSYYFAVPTRSDSTSAGIPWEHFVVTIHTTDPAYYFVLGPDSAYSVDNLAPAQPLGLAGDPHEDLSGIELTWGASVEADFSHYSVYRGVDEFFLPDVTTHLGDTSAPSFSDEYAEWHECWYKVAAVDRHGNASPLAVIGPEDTATGTEPAALPREMSLAQNRPNPFNPSTTISFALPARGFVELLVFDVQGRLVKTLVRETLAEGVKTYGWNGTDDHGEAVSSGVYFCQLKSAGRTITRKMILLK